MFLQLWAVQACTVSSVEGQGLALRGPDGSMDKAVRHMARQSRATYAMFSLGIMLIKASTLIFIINSFSVFVSVPTALLCAIIAFRAVIDAADLISSPPPAGLGYPRVAIGFVLLYSVIDDLLKPKKA